MSHDNHSEGTTRKITLGFVLSWIFAVLFGIPGVMMLFEGKAVTGLLFILTALVLLPPLNTWVEKQFKFALSGMLKFVIVIVLLIAAGISIASSQTASNAASTNPSSTSSATNSIGASAQPPIKISAIQLSDAYGNNEVAADARYKGNVVDVTGVIGTIGKDVLNNPYVTLKTGEYSILSVQCMFSQADEANLASLSSGQSVTLEGTVTGKMVNVVLDGCSVKQH